jgi:hypothetical protein
MKGNNQRVRDLVTIVNNTHELTVLMNQIIQEHLYNDMLVKENANSFLKDIKGRVLAHVNLKAHYEQLNEEETTLIFNYYDNILFKKQRRWRVIRTIMWILAFIITIIVITIIRLF